MHFPGELFDNLADHDAKALCMITPAAIGPQMFLRLLPFAMHKSHTYQDRATAATSG